MSEITDKGEKDTLEMLLQALEGIHEPRRLTVIRTVGAISITIEASNFSGEIWDESPDQSEESA